MSFWSDYNCNRYDPDSHENRIVCDSEYVTEKELSDAKDLIIETTKEYADEYTVDQAKEHAEALQTAFVNEFSERADTFENGIDTRVTAVENAETVHETNVSSALSSFESRVTATESVAGTASTDAANAVATANLANTTADSAETMATEAKNTADMASARLDTAIDAVTTDTEVTDIRVGADGVTYDTAGNAVRGQIEVINEKIKPLYVDPTEIQITENSYINGITGKVVTGQAGVSTDYIDISGRTLDTINVTCSLNNSYGLVFYDKDKSYISGVYGENASEYGYQNTTTPQTLLLQAPINAVYIRMGMRSSFYTDIKSFKIEIQNADPKGLKYEFSEFEKAVPKLESKNLLKDFTDNKRVNYGNGNLYDTTDTAVTDFVKIDSEETYTYSTIGAVLQMAFYDKNKSYLSGLANSGVSTRLTFTAPINAYYIRWTVLKTAKYNTQLEKGKYRTPFGDYKKIIPNKYIDSNNVICAYPTDDLIQLLVENQGKTILVQEGTYDIEQIYNNHFGNDYFDNYVGYDSGNEYVNGVGIGAGLPVFNGTKLVCTSGAKFVFNYNGTNENVKLYFSPFASGDGLTIDGLNCTATNCRYILHDDFNTSGNPFHTTIKNCLLDCDIAQCIGGGMGRFGVYEIKNNIFKGEYKENVSYHNHASAVAFNRMTVKDNYFETRLSLRWFGASTDVSTVTVCGNNLGNDIEYRAEDTTAINQNVELIKWNNVIR